jgi:SAM-dependent methyltransferase
MTWVLVILTLVFLADAVRLRGRIRGLAVLPDANTPPSPDHQFLVTPGVELDDATRRSASAYLKEQGLKDLDLIPADQPMGALIGLMQIVDPDTYRKDRLASGRTAGYALLVDRELLERARVPDRPPSDPVDFLRSAARLKRHACTATDVAVAPGLRALPHDPNRRRAVWRELLGDASVSILVLQPVLIGVLWFGAFLHPLPGLVALAAFHLQPLIAVWGSAIHPRDLAQFVIFRSPIEIWNWFRLVLDRWQPDRALDPVESRRPGYEEAIAPGLAQFLEPRRADCPICGGTELITRLVCRDLIQYKPGEFSLERCADCGHVFQNPRLSIEGLNFYYRDFYDGLGGEGMEAVFGFSDRPYRSRAKTVAEVTRPRRWLDVGAGHGHLCCVAREVFPETRFEGLDLAESVEEAVRRGWIDRSHRGLFPDLAPTFAGQFDMVSMSHYLEHTRDPRLELTSAHAVLEKNGYLLVEVPDPECPLGDILGQRWLPWFQPQHQHLLNATNLGRLLDESGFEALKWVRGGSHLPTDFLFAAFLALGDIAPPVDLPWRPPATWMDRGARRFTLTIGLPLLALGYGLDRLYAVAAHRIGGSNTMRVLARKR